ncbi:Tfp pilus assembly protein FimT/FimU [Massilia sp. 2TAF26]|uniref:pilus assembly FimT family protein n=1 Tax=Massilia sp. 2TAF26 TaxID=3233012 RepID=UPI003F9A7A33
MRERGFTMVELIVIMVLLGIMAAVAVPRLINSGERGAQVFGDQLVSGLRLAATSARAHRRLVCASLGPKALTLRIAVENPAKSAPACANLLANAPDSDFSTSDPDVLASGLSGNLYFQPNGDISSDVDGKTLIDTAQITISAQGSPQRVITLAGGTGYVE